MKIYIRFGGDDFHIVNGKLLNSDTIAVLEFCRHEIAKPKDWSDVCERVSKLFGKHFLSCHHESELDGLRQIFSLSQFVCIDLIKKQREPISIAEKEPPTDRDILVFIKDIGLWEQVMFCLMTDDNEKYLLYDNHSIVVLDHMVLENVFWIDLPEINFNG